MDRRRTVSEGKRQSEGLVRACRRLPVHPSALEVVDAVDADPRIRGPSLDSAISHQHERMAYSFSRT
jgi:hypothetical protein